VCESHKKRRASFRRGSGGKKNSLKQGEGLCARREKARLSACKGKKKEKTCPSKKNR